MQTKKKAKDVVKADAPDVSSKKTQKGGVAQDVLTRNKTNLGLKNDRTKRHDYVSEGLAKTRPDKLFPYLQPGNTGVNDWEYLRREVPHIWYVDSRFPRMGYLSRDEAAILYNTALLFKGKPALEIGCWKGWSTAHLLKGGVQLDVVDIVLDDDEARAELEAIAEGVKATKRINFHPGPSFPTVEEVAQTHNRKWSLMFIDGDHETPAPAQDAETCARHAADDAIIIFHDLASPAVSAGLQLLGEMGWNTRVYQTMQIMGVAWRGKVKPVPHTPDPKVDWALPDHLAMFQLIHESDREFRERAVSTLSRFSEMALVRRNLIASHSELGLSFDKLQKEIVRHNQTIAELRSENERFKDGIEILMLGIEEFKSQKEHLKDEIAGLGDKLVAERDTAEARINSLQESIHSLRIERDEALKGMLTKLSDRGRSLVKGLMK